MQISRSNFYRKIKRVESEELLTENAIINCFNQNERRYGRKRIKLELRKQNIFVSEHKIARILRENDLIAKGGSPKKKKSKKPTVQQYIEENLVTDKFSISTPNELWCSDITELKCRSGKIYVCGIIDVATRRIVGWGISKTQTQRLVQDAFKMAIGRNPIVVENAIYHSDRGSQYTAKATKKLIEESGFKKSMSRPGTPSDNQPIESFWHTLEVEMPDIRHLNFEDAARSIVCYIELYYNSTRMHSGINYLIPNEFFTLLSVLKS